MSLAMEGNLYLFGDKALVYKAKENRWYPVVGLEMDLRRRMCLAGIYDCYCEIDNVIYCYRFHEVLEWYDYEEQSWKVLKGLEEELPKLPTDPDRVTLINCGGKIVVLWDKNVSGINSKKKNIWCAEIVIERRDKHEIYGKVEWCDVVLTILKPCLFDKKLIAVTV